MNARRVTAAPGAGCPRCGAVEAVVRVRGERMGVTCASCRYSEIVPLSAPSCEPSRDSHGGLGVQFRAPHVT